jgi:hypothetical protein
MRSFRTSLTVFLAALYVLLGVNASWHAPHFSRGEVSVGVDAHAVDHEVSSGGEECALCSWKTLSQVSAASGVFAPLAHTAASAQRTVTKAPADGLVRVARARAPPFLS